MTSFISCSKTILREDMIMQALKFSEVIATIQMDRVTLHSPLILSEEIVLILAGSIGFPVFRFLMANHSCK